MAEVAAGGGGLEGAHDTQDGEGAILQAVAWAGKARRFQNDSKGRAEAVDEEPLHRFRREENDGVMSGPVGFKAWYLEVLDITHSLRANHLGVKLYLAWRRNM